VTSSFIAWDSSQVVERNYLDPVPKCGPGKLQNIRFTHRAKKIAPPQILWSLADVEPILDNDTSVPLDDMH